MQLKERTAVVTGGASGIGEATVRRFLAAGAQVVIVDLNEERGVELVGELGNTYGPDAVTMVPVDVASQAATQMLADTVAEQFEGLDILVNNAGIRVYSSLEDATDDEWDAILGVNLKGVANTTQALVPLLRAGDGGSVVNVSSANALIGRARMGQYDATKAAVLSLTRTLAVEHGDDGVRVNAVCPGYTVTRYHVERLNLDEDEVARLTSPGGTGGGILRRAARPEEIANAILFLASPESSYITGETLMVDGGMFAARG